MTDNLMTTSYCQHVRNFASLLVTCYNYAIDITLHYAFASHHHNLFHSASPAPVDEQNC